MIIAVVEREDNVVVPIMKGGEDEDSGSLATWATRVEAEAACREIPLCQAYGATFIDLDEV